MLYFFILFILYSKINLFITFYFFSNGKPDNLIKNIIKIGQKKLI